MKNRRAFPLTKATVTTANWLLKLFELEMLELHHNIHMCNKHTQRDWMGLQAHGHCSNQHVVRVSKPLRPKQSNSIKGQEESPGHLVSSTKAAMRTPCYLLTAAPYNVASQKRNHLSHFLM
jgi:hypothetical protein